MTIPASTKPLAFTALAKTMRPQYLPSAAARIRVNGSGARCLKCLRTRRKFSTPRISGCVFLDFVPAALTGTEHPDKFIAGVCAAGHKAMWNAKWGGYPDAPFLSKLNPKLALLRTRLTTRVYSIDRSVGGLTPAWAKKTGLTAGDSRGRRCVRWHLGAVGSGVAPGCLVKIIGTSTCDIADFAEHKKLADVPGLLRHCGRQRVTGIILTPEAGQLLPSVTCSTGLVNYIQPRR